MGKATAWPRMRQKQKIKWKKHKNNERRNLYSIRCFLHFPLVLSIICLQLSFHHRFVKSSQVNQLIIRSDPRTVWLFYFHKLSFIINFLALYQPEFLLMFAVCKSIIADNDGLPIFCIKFGSKNSFENVQRLRLATFI